jgi:hypothetical protein
MLMMNCLTVSKNYRSDFYVAIHYLYVKWIIVSESFYFNGRNCILNMCNHVTYFRTAIIQQNVGLSLMSSNHIFCVHKSNILCAQLHRLISRVLWNPNEQFPKNFNVVACSNHISNSRSLIKLKITRAIYEARTPTLLFRRIFNPCKYI